MGAYNKFRGDHCCESAYLLRTILKEEWGFEGFTISDFNFGIRRTSKAANAGCDIEMASTKYYGSYLVQAVKDGNVAEAIVNESAERIVRTVLDFTNRSDPLPAYPTSLLACDEHTNLARECAEKSVVLLKNDRGVLPFSKDAVRQIAVIGKLGKVANIGDHGSSQVHPPYVVTLVQGLRNKFGKAVRVMFNDGADVASAASLASASDAVVCIVGYDHSDEGEFLLPEFELGWGFKIGGGIGGDRERLNLKKSDITLVRTVAPVNGQCCVCMIGGSAIMVEEWHEYVPSILMAFYPGMEGGNAISNVLFGDVNPSGKLPFTVPTSTSHLPEFERDAKQVVPFFLALLVSRCPPVL
jgi:beta-glucosidase